MNSISRSPLSGIAKVMLVLFVVVGAIRLVDFIFYGRELRDLIAGVGFALMGYGMYKNGLAREALDPGGRYASIAGVVLVLVAIAMRYLM